MHPAERRRSCSGAIVLYAAVMLLAPCARGDDRLVTLDGAAIDGRVTGIDVDGRLAFEPAPAQALTLLALRRIERSHVKPVDAASSVTVHLADGSAVRARGAAVQGDRCHVQWAINHQWPDLVLPLRALRALRFVAGAEPAPLTGSDKDAPAEAPPPLPGAEGFEQALEAPAVDRDRLFVRSDERVQSVDGIVQQIDAENVLFEWQGKARPVALAKVHGVVFAGAGAAAEPVNRCLVRLADGSALWCQVVKLDGGLLSVRLEDGAELAVPWELVTGFVVRSDRLRFLSDLKPLSVAQSASATSTWPWQRDRSVFGRPITLAGKAFDKGLGVHADCTLSFANTGQFDMFAATIGIDDETAGKGDCVFRVLGDGRQLFEQRMRGGDEPVPVRVPIAGVERISLVVEQGHDWDLADHADWGDARFVRQ